MRHYMKLMKLIKLINNKSVILFVLLFCCITSSSFAVNAPPVANTNSATVGNSSLAPMLQKVLPGVVNVLVRGELPMQTVAIEEQHDAQKRKRMVDIVPKFEDMASGVIVDANSGLILTNAHVVKDAKTITVTLDDGRRMQARVIGFDLPSDIAVIQIKAKHLFAVNLGDSDKMKVGDFVAAIGNPFGLQQTVTSGIISGLERSNLGIEGYENFIQTDASINPGNSGGALVNASGELIGINTALIAPSPIAGNVGIGLAIPSNMAKSVMIQLIKYGKVERGMLGVLVQNVTPALADAMKLPSTDGALVSQVVPGSPAAKADIKSKDVILAIDNTPIHSAPQVSNVVSLVRAGTKIDVKLLRSGKIMNKMALIEKSEKLQKQLMTQSTSLLAGLRLKNFDQLVNNQNIKGVEALSVDDASIAYSCGLRAGDIILSAQDKPVISTNQLEEVAKRYPNQLLLEVRRGNLGTAFLVLEQ